MNSRVYVGVIVAAACFLIACAIIQPSRYDETWTYEPVIRASVESFPKLNTHTVAYGISPIWTWLTGLMGASGMEARLAGRAISILSWIACALLLFSRRERVLTCICLLHPILFVFAARCHPFWVGLAFLLFAAQTRFLALRYLCLAVATSLQPFLIPAALLAGVRHGEQKNLAAECFQIGLAGFFAGLGMLSNWWLYGGQYPAAFKTSEYYVPYLTFDGFTEIYLALICATAGVLMWTLGRGLPSFKKASFCFLSVAGVAGAVIALSDLPRGQVRSLIKAFCQDSRLVWVVAIALGGIGLSQVQMRDWRNILVLALTALILCKIPYSFERYAWFAVVPVFLMAHWGEERSQSPYPIIAAVVCLLAGAALCFVGSV